MVYTKAGKIVGDFGIFDQTGVTIEHPGNLHSYHGHSFLPATCSQRGWLRVGFCAVDCSTQLKDSSLVTIVYSNKQSVRKAAGFFPNRISSQIPCTEYRYLGSMGPFSKCGIPAYPFNRNHQKEASVFPLVKVRRSQRKTSSAENFPVLHQPVPSFPFAFL